MAAEGAAGRKEAAPRAFGPLRLAADGSRLAVFFTDRGAGRAQVTVFHEKLPDGRKAEEMKRYWRFRLAGLKELLES